MYKIFLPLLLLCFAAPAYSQTGRASVSGRITSTDGEAVTFASVFLKNTNYGTTTDLHGRFQFAAPPGEYTLVATAMGFGDKELDVKLMARQGNHHDITLAPKATQIEDVVISFNAVERVRESAFNVIAVDAKSMHNSSLDLAHAMVGVPGVKLRESGGVGSDLKFSLDGFSGRHVKFFIDGVPMDGTGSSFGINNIPVNFADRIEVYKGVVPVEFGADAIGGVVNIVTTQKRSTYLDASYSYGSFNTHRSYVSFGHTTDRGFGFELGAYQNYSDNSYKIDTPVEILEGPNKGQIDMDDIRTVERFHDTYHNETVMAKAGLLGKKYADRLMLGVKLSQSDKEIQNGVKQEIVYGDKRTKAHSVMPSLEYIKRNLATEGLDVRLTANYNYNLTRNIDTSSYHFNWYGQSILTSTLGEQRYQDSEFQNDNWNATLNANYRLGTAHTLTLNHVISAFDRKTQSTVDAATSSNGSSDFRKKSRKNITGLSYKYNYKALWNLSVFGKYYNQYGSGPVPTSSDGYTYELYSGSVDDFGYGAAGTLFLKDFQIKLSYEKALRLPTTDELFGDEDLERGSADLRPEKSDNINLNLSYLGKLGKHSLFVEVGVLYRDTKDYISRSIEKYSGGLYFGSHLNFGRVETKGLNAELRYTYSDWFSLGGSLTRQEILDNEKWVYSGVPKENIGYRERIPNIPYFFTNADASFFIRDLFGKGNILTVTYDNLYVRNFFRYSQRLGSSESKMVIPSQFSHNLSLVYSIGNGRYNISLECRNLTNAKLYDNYSLQKAGRAFYAKFRYYLFK